MQRFFVGLLLCHIIVVPCLQAQKHYDTNSVIITRTLTRDLFDLNSVPYMDPLVTSINSTSNARFFNQAFVPKKVSKPYFRIGVHGMIGFVNEDQKWYTPQLPTEKKPVDFTKYVSFHLDGGNLVVDRLDTIGLATAVVKRLFQKGLDSGKVTMPARAATIFGKKLDTVKINPPYLSTLLDNDPEFAAVFKLLPKETQALLKSAVEKLPSSLQIPPGQDMNTLFAFVPQFEIGSLWGTELMIRFIPPITLDTTIGDFAFWGVALKHSLSQYWDDPFCDLALQVGYQGTSLKNTVGVTASKLESNATFFNVNIHASKKIKNILEVYSGLNYERVDIESSFSYVLSREVQINLGLLEVVDGVVQPPDPAKGYPGDNVVQTSTAHFSNNNVKWTLGIAKQIGPIAIFVDYSVSKFNIFSGGIEYRF